MSHTRQGKPFIYMKRTIDSNITIYVDRFPLFPSFGLYNEMLQYRSLTPVNAITFDPKRAEKRDEILQLSTC